ncbi:hypothetical protein FOL47_004715 [Perkinsus chesapeaki]|uniref:Thymus-specific serine protease n=1 Tax=Perkinsus chesapeaki TaxID=330153 RepID=A0A7J6M152_PERCH|nr:hypothetical protein FOL47_004715 [Perkinsus chesapeaki]
MAHLLLAALRTGLFTYLWLCETEARQTQNLGRTEAAPRGLQGVGASQICVSDYFQEHGYIEVDSGVKYFYWFIQSYGFPSSDPTVIWTPGEPGLSSLMSFLTSNGPCIINTTSGAILNNSLNWNQAFNLVYLDEPAGVGFSTGKIETDSNIRAAYLRNFTVAFFKKFPQYNHRVYYFGSSQSGLVIPKAAKLTYEYNVNKSKRHQIDFTGVALLNALTSFRTQIVDTPKTAYGSPTTPRRITKEQYEKMNLENLQCVSQATICNQDPSPLNIACKRAAEACQNSSILNLPREVNINMYNLGEVCMNQVPDYCRPFAQAEAFLNKAEVKKSIGVDPSFVYKRYNPEVDNAIQSSYSQYEDSYPILGPLIDTYNMKLLVLTGDLGYIYPWTSSKTWLLNLKFSQQEAFSKAPDYDLKDSSIPHPFGQVRYLKLPHKARLVFVRVGERSDRCNLPDCVSHAQIALEITTVYNGSPKASTAEAPSQRLAG